MPHKDPDVRRAYKAEWVRRKRVNDTEFADRERKAAREYQRRLRTADPLFYGRSRKYGLTLDQYVQLLGSQGNACAACGESFEGHVERYGRQPDIDHDHSCCDNGDKACGSCVRGILCRTCNRLAVDAKRLRMVAEYLERFE